MISIVLTGGAPAVHLLADTCEGVHATWPDVAFIAVVVLAVLGGWWLCLHYDRD